MKPKINKLFLFTCGAGEVERVESERRGLASSPPPSRLFVTECRPERPAQARGSTGTTLGADDPTREVRDCQPHIARASRAGPCAADRGAVCQGNRRRTALPDSHRPAGPAHNTPHRPGRRVGGRGCRHLSRASGLPHPKRKVQEPERGDKRKDSTLRVRGWERPLPPREVKLLAAQPTSDPPTQPFKPLSAPCYCPLLQTD